MFRAIILLMLLCSVANAQEVVTSYDIKTLPVLNEELRKTRESYRSLKATVEGLNIPEEVTFPLDISSASVVSGVLAIANGGTGASTAPTAINALLPTQGSASGKFLTTNGSAASWGAVVASPFTLVTTVTTADNVSSGSITLDATKHYMIKMYYSNTTRAGAATYIKMLPNASNWVRSYYHSNNGSTGAVVTATDTIARVWDDGATTNAMNIVATIDMNFFSVASIPSMGAVYMANYIASSSGVGGGYNTFYAVHSVCSGYMGRVNAYIDSITFVSDQAGDWKIFVYTLD